MNALSQYALSVSILAIALAALVICVLVMTAGFAARSYVKTELIRLLTRRGHAVAGALFGVAAVLAMIGLSVSPSEHGVTGNGSHPGPNGLRSMDEQIGKVEPLVDRMRRGVGLILVRVETLWQAAVPNGIASVPKTIVARVSEALSQRAEPAGGQVRGLASTQPSGGSAQSQGEASIRTEDSVHSQAPVPGNGNGASESAAVDTSFAAAAHDAPAVTIFRNGGPDAASQGQGITAPAPGQHKALMTRTDPIPVERRRPQSVETTLPKSPARVEKPLQLQYPGFPQKGQTQGSVVPPGAAIPAKDVKEGSKDVAAPPAQQAKSSPVQEANPAASKEVASPPAPHATPTPMQQMPLVHQDSSLTQQNATPPAQNLSAPAPKEGQAAEAHLAATVRADAPPAQVAAPSEGAPAGQSAPPGQLPTERADKAKDVSEKKAGTVQQAPPQPVQVVTPSPVETMTPPAPPTSPAPPASAAVSRVSPPPTPPANMDPPKVEVPKIEPPKINKPGKVEIAPPKPGKVEVARPPKLEPPPKPAGAAKK